MKKLFLATLLFAGYSVYAQDQAIKVAADGTNQDKETSYGVPFEETNVITVPELMKRAAEKEIENVVVSGKIAEVCQAEGCWMRVSKETDDGSSMLVKFKDHSFVIPKDLAGKQVVFIGKAYQATVSVKMLQHYAEDAGKSKDEIAKITEPSNELAFIATGLIIK